MANITIATLADICLSNNYLAVLPNTTLTNDLQNYTVDKSQLEQICPLFLNKTANTDTEKSQEPPIISLSDVVWGLAFITMLTTAISGNAVVVWIVLAHRRMRTVTNMLLLNMSMADLIMSLFNCVFNFVFMLKGYWYFGTIYCTINNMVANTSVPAAVFSLTALTLERYMAIVYPLKPRPRKRHCCGGIVLIWLVAAIFALPCALFSQVVRVPGSDTVICILMWPDMEGRIINDGSFQEYIYNWCFLVTTYLVPLLVMGHCFISIYKKLWLCPALGHVQASRADALIARKKVVKMCLIVFLVFAVFWCPYQVYFVCVYHYPQMSTIWYMRHVFLSFYLLAMSTAMINPLVYYWVNTKFRSYFRYVFNYCCLCHWRTRLACSLQSSDRAVVSTSQMHDLSLATQNSVYHHHQQRTNSVQRSMTRTSSLRRSMIRLRNVLMPSQNRITVEMILLTNSPRSGRNSSAKDTNSSPAPSHV